MEINRKLATIERIVSIEKHPNADTLDIVGIRGWKVISKQGQGYEVGKLIIFIEIDGFLPFDDKRFEFLGKDAFKSTKNLGDGWRLRTKKIRGEYSQGLIMPLEEFPELGFTYAEGDDVTELLRIQKYEAPIPVQLQGAVRGNFPAFIPKTDEERLQNLSYRDREVHKDDTFEVTQKMDGSSMTVYWNSGDFGVCSRNLDLKEYDENNFEKFGERGSQNLYWQVANKYNLKEKLAGKNVALQGELVGPGVNNNHSREKNHDFYIFNIYDIENKRYLDAHERTCFILNEGDTLGRHVPVLDYCGFPNVETIQDDVEKIRYNDLPIEGVVYKSITDPSFSFKYINNSYLLKHE